MRLITVILLLFYITACSSSNNNETTEVKSINNEELSEEELFLIEMENTFNTNKIPSNVLKQIDAEIDNIQNESVKQELINLVGKAALKITNNAIEKIALSSFEIEDIEKLDIDNVKYFEYLNDETKMKVLDVCGYFKTKNYFLTKKGYELEYIDEYKEIKTGDFNGDVQEHLRKSNSEFEDLISIENSLINVDNLVVMDFLEERDLTSYKIERMFKIINENGESVNPRIALVGYENIIAKEIAQYKKEQERAIEESREAFRLWQEEQKESEKIRLGMTSDEVLERWGKPKDINRTITQYGTSEQWIYGGYRYLYFDDGILTAIQD